MTLLQLELFKEYYMEVHMYDLLTFGLLGFFSSSNVRHMHTCADCSVRRVRTALTRYTTSVSRWWHMPKYSTLRIYVNIG